MVLLYSFSSVWSLTCQLIITNSINFYNIVHSVFVETTCFLIPCINRGFTPIACMSSDFHKNTYFNFNKHCRFYCTNCEWRFVCPKFQKLSNKPYLIEPHKFNDLNRVLNPSDLVIEPKSVLFSLLALLHNYIVVVKNFVKMYIEG